MGSTARTPAEILGTVLGKVDRVDGLCALMRELNEQGAGQLGSFFGQKSEGEMLAFVRGLNTAPPAELSRIAAAFNAGKALAGSPTSPPQETKQARSDKPPDRDPRQPAFLSVMCDSCHAKLRAKPDQAGKRLKCAKCGQPVSVPSGTAPAPASASGPARRSPGGGGPRAKGSAAGLPLRSTVKLLCKTGESGHQFERLGLIGEDGTRETYTEHWRINDVTVRFPEDASVEDTIMCPTCMGNVKLKIAPDPAITLPFALGVVAFAVLAAGVGLWWIPTLEDDGGRVIAIALLWVLFPLMAFGSIMAYREQSAEGYKPKATVTILDDCGYVERTLDSPDLIRANRRHKLEQRKCTRGA